MFLSCVSIVFIETIGDTGKVILPRHESPEDLANDFSEFFLNKIATIWNINMNNSLTTGDTRIGRQRSAMLPWSDIEHVHPSSNLVGGQGDNSQGSL